jgi:hypothetical protein
VFSIVQSVRPGPSDGTGLPVSSPFIARTGRTIPVRPSWTSDGTIYNLPRPSNLWTGTDGGRLPRHRKNSDIFGTQRDLRYLNNEATISRGSLIGAALICYRAPPIAAIQWGCISVEAECTECGGGRHITAVATCRRIVERSKPMNFISCRV